MHIVIELVNVMTQNQYNQIVTWIWGIANDCLVQVFEKGDYKKVILPFLVLRRIDILLEDTKEQVLKFSKGIPEEKIHSFEPKLFKITGYNFCNTSNFTMSNLLTGGVSEQTLYANFKSYLDGFSTDVKDIIDKFELYEVARKLYNNHRLDGVITKFLEKNHNLGTKPILNEDGTEKLPALDNHTMGVVFEELLRRFNEENSVTEAGEHFTPRDYVEMLADIAINPISDKLKDNTYSIYDGACGTGGILSVAQDKILDFAQKNNKKINIQLFGQEIQPNTFATCKADLMISNHKADNIKFGSTISSNGFKGNTFDFCISNPPFGTPWKEDLRGYGVEKKEEINDSRFVIGYDGDNNYKLLPGIDDPQMLFLANNVSRMKDTTELGTRIVEVHNGSSLFTGNAGGGESNLRRYIIENDMLEAIIAMPESDFYNTEIGTYIWVVTNRKEDRRKGKVQLIDATSIYTPLRKNMGKKSRETNENDRNRILALLTDFSDSELSKIFPNEEFGYTEIKILRPLRLQVDVNVEAIESLKVAKDQTPYVIMTEYIKQFGEEILLDYNLFAQRVSDIVSKLQLKYKKAYANTLKSLLTAINPKAEPVLDEKGNQIPDNKLTESEQIPLLYEGGIDKFFVNEIKPYTPDAWVDYESAVIGYELSFTKYFYKPTQLRNLDVIQKEIMEIDQETKGMLEEIFR